MVDHGRRVFRRTPDLLELAWVGVDLPDPLHGRREIGDDGQGPIVEVVPDVDHGHGSVLRWGRVGCDEFVDTRDAAAPDLLEFVEK